jgi:hypothetical protein
LQPVTGLWERLQPRSPPATGLWERLQPRLPDPEYRNRPSRLKALPQQPMRRNEAVCAALPGGSRRVRARVGSEVVRAGLRGGARQGQAHGQVQDLEKT